MSEVEIINIIEEIFKDVLDDDTLKIDESSNVDNVDGWDSLAHISILEIVQDEFNIHFSLDEMVDLTSVDKIVYAIKQKIKE